MKVNLFYTTLLAFGFWISETSAQVFRHFSEREGAPVTTVMAITQDHEGFLWFASSRGLYRYDSKVFKKYIYDAGRPGSIASDYIQSIYCDSEGRLWIATWAGLSLYNRESDTFTTFKHDAANPGSLSSNRVLCMVQDSEKKIWVGTARGLNEAVMEEGKIRFVRARHQLTDSTQLIRSMAAGKDGELWLGTGQGLVRVKGTEARLMTGNGDQQYPAGNQINSLHPDEKGALWLGTSRGVFRFDTIRNRFSRVEGEKYDASFSGVYGIAEDSANKLWMATESGLLFLDPSTGNIKRFRHERGNSNSLADEVLYAVYIDRRGGLWLGSYHLGASYLDRGLPDFTKWPVKPENDRYESFLNGWIGNAGSNGMWTISGDYSELISVDRENGSIFSSDLSPLKSTGYYTFFVDRSGVLWCGGNFLLTSFDLKTRKTVHYTLPPSDRKDSPGRGRVHVIFEDSRGMLWVGGVFGFMSFDRQKRDFGRADSRDFIYSAMEDSAGNLWFGGKSFVFVLKAGTETVNALDIDSTAFSDNPKAARRIAQDPSGRIWIASEQGLQLYDAESDKLKLYTEDAPELLNYTIDIQVDSRGYLWLNGEHHLVRYHPDKRTAQVYDYRDGLPQNGLLVLSSSVKDENSYLYFPTNNGAFRFDPEKINVHNESSPIALTSLKLFNHQVWTGDQTGILKRSIETTREIVFRYDQNIFALEFALLNYARSERNQYAYKLEGFEKDWNYVETPSATYTNLPSGTYTFMVKAANGDGYWNPEPLKVQIVVLPPWWKTWYAYLFYTLILAGIVYVINRFFWLRRVVRQENELYHAKLDFFTNISHEIRTHLSLISGPVEKAWELSENDDKLRGFLTYAKNNSDRLLLLVNELLDFRKIQNSKTRLWIGEHDVAAVTRNILASFEHLASKKGITASVESPEQPVMLWFDLSQIQKVFYNLLGNAFKFTPEGGRISIRITEELNRVTIEVRDNGPGIAPQYLDRLFINFFQVYENNTGNTGYGIGLALSREIVVRHQGELTVKSRQKTGAEDGETCFSLTLLKDKDHFAASDLAGASTAIPPNIYLTPDANHSAGNTVVSAQQKCTLLLIDDNEELRAFATETLRDAYQILEANNGQSGLELAREHMPDLIVCDVMMPGMNGLEVSKTLRSEFQTRHIPIILVSARSTAEQMMEGLQAGADEYLIKPFDFRMLELKIDNLITTRKNLKEIYGRSISLEPDNTNIDNPDEEFISRLKHLVADNISEPDFGVNEMAFQTGISVSVLYRKLRALTGMTVNEFTKNIRMRRALQLLESGSFNVNEVANMVGFDDSRYFSKEFSKTFGRKPSEVKRKNNTEKKDY